MRSVSTLLLALCVAAGCSDEDPGVREVTEYRSVDLMGETRSYLLHVPEGIEPRNLIIAFHGAGGTGMGLHEGSDLARAAELLDAVVAYPEADHFNWAEDCGCTNADIVHGVSDTAFVALIGTSLAQEFDLDADRLLAVGFSQGGMFAHRLACQMSDRFHRISVVAATMSVPLSENCDSDGSVAVQTIISTSDPIFPWSGSEDGALSTLGAPELSRDWAARNECSLAFVDTEGAGRTYREHEGCPNGAEVELVGVHNGAHAWFMSPLVDTAMEIARFMQG